MNDLTNPQRVRDRIGVSQDELPDTRLADFIADQQAYVEAATRRTITPDDPLAALAGSVVTDLAATMALTSLTGGTTTGLDYHLGKLDVRRKAQLDHRLKVLAELKDRAARGLDLLERSARTRRFVLINGAE